MICCLLCQSAFSLGPLIRRIDLSLDQAPLLDALNAVSQEADFQWSFNPKILPADKRISLQVKNELVREVLLRILGNEFQYKENGNYLIIKKQKPPEDQLSGYIVDPQTGKGLANATVYDRNSLRATQTDSSGHFELKASTRTPLVVSKIGYREILLEVPDTNRVHLELKPTPIPPPSDLDKLRLAYQRTGTQLEQFFAATVDFWLAMNVPDTLQRNFQVSLLPKLGTNHVLDGKVINRVSLNLLAGQSAGVNGIELAGISNFTKKEVRGIQLAGFSNHLRGNLTGIQASGFYNFAHTAVKGFQFAGFVNQMANSEEIALQAAGFANIVTQKTEQAQAVFQFSGFYNHAARIKGLQVSGGANFAQQMDGVQVSVVNWAGQINGAQISSTVNIARQVNGLQIGLVNWTNDLQGIQLGLINRSNKRVLPFINWGF